MTKIFCQNICGHLVCWYVLHPDVFILDVGAYEMMANVNCVLSDYCLPLCR